MIMSSMEAEPHLYEMEQDPAGPSGYKSFLGTNFLFVGNRLLSASLTFPEFKRADSNSCLSGKGGNAETKEE